jgi:hypothetical protein
MPISPWDDPRERRISRSGQQQSLAPAIAPLAQQRDSRRLQQYSQSRLQRRRGTQTVSLLPINTPGIDPTRSFPARATSTSLSTKRWASAAAPTRRNACATSVPTSFSGVSETVITNKAMIRLPLPIEVNPTRNPPNAPMATSLAAGRFARCSAGGSAVSRVLRQSLWSIKLAAMTSITPINRSSTASTAVVFTE